MSQERYFLYLDGVQRGPYTVAQIGHMVNSRIVHPSAMFWCEGLEQWQPVTQLIVHKDEKKRRRISVSAWMLGFLGLLLVLFWMAGPRCAKVGGSSIRWSALHWGHIGVRVGCCARIWDGFLHYDSATLIPRKSCLWMMGMPT